MRLSPSAGKVQDASVLPRSHSPAPHIGQIINCIHMRPLYQFSSGKALPHLHFRFDDPKRGHDIHETNKGVEGI